MNIPNLYPTDKPHVTTTVSGVRLDLLRPDPTLIRRADILHSHEGALRYGANTRVGWSTLKHCVAGTMICEQLGFPEDVQLAFMYHDAAECYTGDILGPLKALLMPLFEPIEKGIEKAIQTALKLPEWFDPYTPSPKSAQVKYVDHLILHGEAFWYKINLQLPAHPNKIEVQIAKNAVDDVTSMSSKELLLWWIDTEEQLRSAK